MFLGVLGGWMAGVYGGFTSSEEFINGCKLDFIPFHIVYAFLNIFAMLLAIPSFHGYYMKVAHSSRSCQYRLFVWTSVTIILFNYILTQLLLGS
jgi:phospholipid/cholesterol/gamma-HCH transport system permease protein